MNSILEWVVTLIPFIFTAIGAGGFIHFLEWKLNRSKFTHDARMDDKDDLRKDMALFRSEIKEMRDDYKVLETEFEEKKKKIDELEQEVAALKKQRVEQDYEFHNRWWAARSVFDKLLTYIRKSPLANDDEFRVLEEAVANLYQDIKHER